MILSALGFRLRVEKWSAALRLDPSLKESGMHSSLVARLGTIAAGLVVLVGSYARPACSQASVVAVDTTTRAATSHGPAFNLGELVRVSTTDGRRLTGWIFSRNDTGFVVGRRAHSWSGGGRDSTRVAYAQLTQLEVRRAPHWRLKAIGGGLALGLAVGAAVGARSVKNSCEGGTGGFGPCFSRSDGTIMGALLGAGLGGSVGMAVSYPRWRALSMPARAAP